MNQTPPGAEPGTALWILTGGLMMAALLFFRRTSFWLPHPIGLIMLINPLMRAYWFSILIGWLAKTLVTRYGNRNTYINVRPLFVGLIVGELLIVTASLILSYFLNLRTGIDLNRSW
jgi:hypothetical protein